MTFRHGGGGADDILEEKMREKFRVQLSD